MLQFPTVDDLKSQITLLADLMDEYGLDEARLEGDDWRIDFSRTGTPVTAVLAPLEGDAEPRPKAPRQRPAPVAPQPSGRPIPSPMMGIYYNAPSPGAAPFVKVGDHVVVGQVIGLIEAMKVFNEVTAGTSGTVTQMVAKNGDLVQAGDPLLLLS